jgi:hypothetical protein
MAEALLFWQVGPISHDVRFDFLRLPTSRVPRLWPVWAQPGIFPMGLQRHGPNVGFC